MSSRGPSGEAGPDCQWLERLSRGGLYLPSPQWLQQVEAFDVVFCAMHGNNIDRGPGVIRRIREDLDHKFPRIDSWVVRKYAVTRTHHRPRHLQHRLSEARRDERNAKRMRMYARAARQSRGAVPGNRTNFREDYRQRGVLNYDVSVKGSVERADPVRYQSALLLGRASAGTVYRRPSVPR